MFTKCLPCVAALALLLAAAGNAQAETYTWIAGNGTFAWETPAHWSPSTGYPNAIGDIANISSPTGDTTLEVSSAAITLGQLVFGAGRVRTIRGAGGAAADTLIFDNGASNASVTRGNAGTTTGAAMHFTTYQLNSSLDVNYSGLHITSMLTLHGRFTGPGSLNIANVSGDHQWPGFTLDGSDHDYTGGTTVTSATLTLQGTIATGVVLSNGTFRITKAGAQSSVLGGAISGTGTVMSSGNFTFDNDANSWQGPLRTIADFPGVIRFTSIGNVGAGPSSLGNPQTAVQGAITLTGGGSSLEYIGAGDSTDRIIQMNAFTGSWTTAINASGTTTLASPFEITSNLTGGSTGRLQLGGTGAGVWSGNIGTTAQTRVEKIGSGTWTLSGANTYTVGTTISGGTLVVGSIDVAANPNPLGMSSNAAANLLLGNGTTLKYTGGTATTDRLFTINGTAAGHGATLDASGTGPVSFSNTGVLAWGSGNQARTLTLAGTNTDNNTLAAAIGNNGTGAVSLQKSGDGTWVLAGASSYTGPTTVGAGTLLVNGSLGNTAVAVNSGGTLGGIGTAGGAVTVHGGGTLGPGASIGALGLGGSLSLLPGSIFDWEFNSTAQTADLLNVAGPVSLTDSILQLTDLDPTAPLLLGTKFTLISYDDQLTGTFAGLADNDLFSAAGYLWEINYFDTVGGVNSAGSLYNSFVTLTVAVPEPSSVLLLAFGLLGVLACGRRRRK